MITQELTKYEKARVLGARALQIAMNAPLLIKISQEDLEKIKFDALKIAEVELESNVLPIKVKHPMPKKALGEKLKRVKEQVVSDEQLNQDESDTEKEISEEGEIMALANPEEEMEDAGTDEGEAD